jgi:uncharacterized membrane protein YvbJ
MKRKPDPPEICPACGEDVPRNAWACPACGADEKSGWKPDAHIRDGLDLPDQEFNYEDFVAEEFGSERSRSGKSILLAAVAAIMLIVFLILYFR